MKKFYFYVLLLPLWGMGSLFGSFAFAQTSVTITGTTYSVPPKVSFTVSWAAAPYDDAIWVITDYIKVTGVSAVERTPASVTEVIATGGATASTVTGTPGIRLKTAGNSGSASVTATLSPGSEIKFNWCAYAFDYPPNAVLQSDGTYELHGTPPFTVNGVTLAAGEKTFGAGTCITSITDATNNPEGIVLATAWSSGGDASQTVTVGDAITPITFETTCTTCTASVTSSGLPYGVSGTWSSPNYTVSGIPVLTGTYNYTLTAEDGNGCSNAAVNGTIKVEALPGANQDQGSCTFTQPVVVSTFALFPATNYSASTFVTLTDERDRNNYTVVKMPDGKWWMAQNLNYQGTTHGTYTFDLYWNQNSNQANGKAFTTSGAGTPAIGSFWCPAGMDGATASVSSANRAGCILYGALYTYETAMMLDGKWSDETHSSSNFATPTGNYGINTTSGNTNNNAHGVTKRGICPPNWHVPTDAEWGNMLNKASLNNTNFNSGSGWLGINDDPNEAGARLKATCICPSGNTNCVDDTQNNWLYPPVLANVGTDVYGFRLLPAGYRNPEGSYYLVRGQRVIYWSSSRLDTPKAWFRSSVYNQSLVQRSNQPTSHAFSIRCVRD